MSFGPTSADRPGATTWPNRRVLWERLHLFTIDPPSLHRREMPLGNVEDVSLAEAREKAAAARALVRRKLDPRVHAARRASTAMSATRRAGAVICNLVGLKRSIIDQRIKDGRFPSAIRISARRSVWPEADIATWQQEQI